ncbi:unnamed protein product [Medioppia subpectinata]|uniref:Methyltransferase type 11 domain-containing protein n=1 Tax=Medioppia subpectinata TaxID=1979941 RepID=A0A7R9Q4Q2_9ACAR|nr:unnamed protein product [Medioppia subpectinata]CAG2111603.1 unnamed protein product [Medioppia subpectinata]
MDVITPKAYGSTNVNQRRIATKTFDILLANNRQEFTEYLDIGSGDGGITKLLASRVPHRRLIGIDSVPAMTDYARQVNSMPTIKYITQDMSVLWPELSADIRRLEGTVDLIFSNLCFMYFYDKSRTLSICRRLLTTGGSIYANFILLGDVNKKLPPNERFNNFLSVDRQIQVWRRALADNGLAVDTFDVYNDKWFIKRELMIVFLPVLVCNYRSYFESIDHYASECPDLSDAVFDIYTNPTTDRPNPNAWKQFVANENNNTEAIIHFQMVTLICHKN